MCLVLYSNNNNNNSFFYFTVNINAEPQFAKLQEFLCLCCILLWALPYKISYNLRVCLIIRGVVFWLIALNKLHNIFGGEFSVGRKFTIVIQMCISGGLHQRFIESIYR